MIFSAPAEIGIVANGVVRLDDNRVRVRRGEFERLPVDLQLVLHRRVQRFVERHLRAEQDVFGRKGMAVGEFRPRRRWNVHTSPSARHLPRLGDHRNRLLPRVVVVNEKGKEVVIRDVGRGCFVRHHRVERAGIARLREDEAAAMLAERRSIDDQGIFRQRMRDRCIRPPRLHAAGTPPGLRRPPGRRRGAACRYRQRARHFT